MIRQSFNADWSAGPGLTAFASITGASSADRPTVTLPYDAIRDLPRSATASRGRIPATSRAGSSSTRRRSTCRRSIATRRSRSSSRASTATRSSTSTATSPRSARTAIPASPSGRPLPALRRAEHDPRSRRAPTGHPLVHRRRHLPRHHDRRRRSRPRRARRRPDHHPRHRRRARGRGGRDDGRERHARDPHRRGSTRGSSTPTAPRSRRARAGHAAAGASERRRGVRLYVPAPALWSADSPTSTRAAPRSPRARPARRGDGPRFGIRTLQLDPTHGLRINGETVKLRGACIHHDNGLLGAATIARAEERRVEILKEAGFNAIRSAHNPISRAMLDACDRVGMLVMDETFDMWTKAKSSFDYSLAFPEWWERDVEAMVAKDFNHPSVILYSIGNEILETGTPIGSTLGPPARREGPLARQHPLRHQRHQRLGRRRRPVAEMIGAEAAGQRGRRQHADRRHGRHDAQLSASDLVTARDRGVLLACSTSPA